MCPCGVSLCDQKSRDTLRRVVGLFGFTAFITNNEGMIALDVLFEVGMCKANPVCISGISLNSGWSLALSLYHPQVARATAPIFDAPREREFGLAGHQSQKALISEGELFGGFGTHCIQTGYALDTNPVGCQNVKCGSHLTFNLIPGLNCC